MKVNCVWNNKYSLITRAGFCDFTSSLRSNEEQVEIEIPELVKNWDDYKLINIIDGKGELVKRTAAEKDEINALREKESPPDLYMIFDFKRQVEYSVSKEVFPFGLDSKRVLGRYLKAASGSYSPGYRMPRNGIVLAFSIENDNVLEQDTAVYIRINNVDKTSVIIKASEMGTSNHELNINFLKGDVIRCFVGKTGSYLKNPTAFLEVAWKAEVEL